MTAERSTRWIGVVFGLAILATSVALIGPVRGTKIVVMALFVGILGAKQQPELLAMALSVVAATFLGVTLPLLAMILPPRTSVAVRVAILMAAAACVAVDVVIVRIYEVTDGGPRAGRR